MFSEWSVVLGLQCERSIIPDSGQWRRQDLLRGGAKMEIMSWRTSGSGEAAAR